MTEDRDPRQPADDAGGSAESGQIFAGGGQSGALMRSMDWSQTPLGAPATWPQRLRTIVGILLDSRYPMFIFWGPKLVKIYNDGYRPILGARHPWAMGRPGPEVWPEIWDTIGPMVERVVERGEATWSDDLPLFMTRHGFPEEVYFTFSYSPIREEAGGVGGVLCAGTETTDKVLGERRLRTLRDLAADPSRARTVEDACRLSARVLDANTADIPFSLSYLLEDGGAFRLASSSGVEPDAPVSPAQVRPGDDCGWPLPAVAENLRPQVVTSLSSRFPGLPSGPWPEPPDTALALPLVARGSDRPSGVIILGTSSRRSLDDQYRDHLALVAGQIGMSIANALASEQERQRAGALAEVDRAKTAFVSSVGHELRTSIALMLGHLEQLLRTASPSLTPELRGDVQIVQGDALRLRDLANTMLDSSRIEAERGEASVEPFSARELLAHARSQLALEEERNQLEAEREKRLHELEHTVRSTELFVGTLGHDLRTPLNAIALGAQLVRDLVEGSRGAQDVEALSRPVARIAASARRMGRMIEQILDFIRARVRPTLERSPTDLAQVLRQVVDELRAQHAGADIGLELDGDLTGEWDIDGLTRLASNLIGNALEHGRAGSAVLICADGTEAATVRFEVRNQGAIAAEFLPVLFDPFRGRNLRSSGLGLGLFITRQIALAHGGNIQVESSEAEGTRFVVRLPRFAGGCGPGQEPAPPSRDADS